MTGVQVHHPWWESIAVIRFLPAMSLQAMRSWFILKQTIIMAIIMDSKWNTIQQVSKTHQFKIKLNIIYAKFFGISIILLFKSDKVLQLYFIQLTNMVLLGMAQWVPCTPRSWSFFFYSWIPRRINFIAPCQNFLRSSKAKSQYFAH